MDSQEKLKFMADVVKPITNLLDNRMNNKVEALKAYDTLISESDPEVKRMREMEAIKLRHEISVLNDLKTTIKAMYPNA